jgi:hypothetical protein
MGEGYCCCCQEVRGSLFLTNPGCVDTKEHQGMTAAGVQALLRPHLERDVTLAHAVLPCCDTCSSSSTHSNTQLIRSARASHCYVHVEQDGRLALHATHCALGD